MSTMMTTTKTRTGARLADSPTVVAKAKDLPVRWVGTGDDGEGMFEVEGHHGTYTVTVADPGDVNDPETFGCDCLWGQNGGVGCSHARATSRFLVAAQAGRKVAR